MCQLSSGSAECGVRQTKSEIMSSTVISSVIVINHSWLKRYGTEEAHDFISIANNELEDEIKQLSSKFFLNSYLNKKLAVSIKYVSEEKYGNEIHKNNRFFTLASIPKTYIEISVTLNYTKKEILNFKKHFGLASTSKDRFLMDMRSRVAEQLDELVWDILIYIELSKLGVVSFSDRYIFYDNIFHRETKRFRTPVREAIQLSSKHSWPPLATIPLSNIVKWLSINKPERVIARTMLDKAVASFSNLASDKSHLKLIWALIGLETLYCSGNSGLQAQLIEKSETFLGKRTAYKKVFPKMYNYRSRLVHGEIPIPFPNKTDYDESLELSVENDEYEIIAIGILLSTLQKMCNESLKELNFSYQLVKNA